MRLARIVRTGLLILIALGCAPRSFGAMPCCQGDDWLAASDEVRTVYVSGLIEGLTTGFGRGCLTATKGVKAAALGVEADPFHICLTKSYAFPQSAKEYVRLITEFYQTHRDDRGMPVLDLLVKLSQGVSPEQIHLDRKQAHVEVKP